MTVNVYTPSPALGSDDANADTNFRTFVKLSGASNGQIRVTFRASSTTNLNLVGASFGKWDGVALDSTHGDMTATAFRLTFSAANGTTITAGTTVTSDFITHTGLSLASGDWLVIAWDNSTPAGERFSTGHTTATTMFLANAADFSQAQTVSGTGFAWTVVGAKQPGDAGATNYVIDQVETNDPGGSSPFANGARRIFV